MPIEFHCEHCGKMVRAPDDKAGRRGRCPSCHQSVYIPTPSDKLEPLSLTPTDQKADEEQKRLIRESQELAKRIATDEEVVEGPSEPPANVPQEVLPPQVDVETVLIEYAKCMAAGDLSGAEELAVELRQHRAAAEEIMQRLTIDELPHAQLADIPRPVLVGFFKRLRARP